MLIISPEQKRMFTEKIRAQFAEKLTGQLQADYPELFHPLPPALALRMVSKKIDYAQYRYEINYKSSLTVFLHYCCAIGPAFDRQPDIQAVLDDLSLYPDEIPALLPEVVDCSVFRGLNTERICRLGKSFTVAQHSECRAQRRKVRPNYLDIRKFHYV